MRTVARRFALLVGLAAIVAPAIAVSSESVERGEFLYRTFCTSCHGVSGRGDGPTAEVLRVAPADLTRIAARHGGTFPTDRVYRTIDGREVVRGHGRRQMPIWGLGFQDPGRDTNQEDEVRERILHLIDYLESIQVDVAAEPRRPGKRRR